MQKVQCPHCNATFRNDGSLSGQVVACPKCHGQFQMPALVPVAQPVGQPKPPAPAALNGPARLSSTGRAEPIAHNSAGEGNVRAVCGPSKSRFCRSAESGGNYSAAKARSYGCRAEPAYRLDRAEQASRRNWLRGVCLLGVMFLSLLAHLARTDRDSESSTKNGVASVPSLQAAIPTKGKALRDFGVNGFDNLPPTNRERFSTLRALAEERNERFRNETITVWHSGFVRRGAAPSCPESRKGRRSLDACGY